MKKWFTKVKKDLLTRQFVSLKILYFLMIGGMTTLFPFLTIQARSLGITGTELGIIYSLLPIIGIFAPNLAGLLADKIGNFKIFLSTTVACSGLAALLFFYIPVGRIEHTLPEQLPLTLNCTMSDNMVVVNSPYDCNFKNETDTPLIVLEQCSYKCQNTVQQKHLIRQLMLTWCQRTPGCRVEEVSIESVAGDISQSDSSLYNFNGQTGRETSHYLFLNNETIAIKLTQVEDKTTMGVNQLFCPDFQKFIESNKEFYPSVVLEESERKMCWMECNATVPRTELCRNTKSTETLNPSLTVVLYTIVRLINGLTLSTSFTLFSGAVVAVLKEYNGDLGLQRMYGNLGMIVLTPISGKLIDYFSQLNAFEDYRPAFFLYCGIKLLCAGILLFLNLEFKPPSNRVLKDFKELLLQTRVFTFILFTAAVGTIYGFLETFLFWVLEDLGADKSLMGMTVTTGAIFGIPVLMTSSFFIKRLGHVNTQCLCMAFYIIRLLGYSLIRNPWLAMPFEALECFTNSLMVVSSVSYAGLLSKPSTVASLQGIYSGTYHGVGRGFGSLAGGVLIKSVGNSTTFQIMAAVSAVSSCIYYLINKFVFERETNNIADQEDGNNQSVNIKSTEKSKVERETTNEEFTEQNTRTTST